MTLSPATYAEWRRGTVGRITERLECDLVFTLTGPVGGRRVLDIGCGDGTYAIEASLRGAESTGVDRSAPMLDAARRRAATLLAPPRLCRGDASALPFPDGSFDMVIATTVLCVAAHPEEIMAEAARVLRPGGTLVVGELGRWSAWAAWRRVRGWFGNGAWSGATFRTPRQLRALVRRAGLEPGRVRGAVRYLPAAPLARALGPLDPLIGSVTTLGAAFIAVAAVKPSA